MGLRVWRRGLLGLGPWREPPLEWESLWESPWESPWESLAAASGYVELLWRGFGCLGLLWAGFVLSPA